MLLISFAAADIIRRPSSALWSSIRALVRPPVLTADLTLTMPASTGGGLARDRYQAIERRGGEVVAHALAWLTQHPKGPFFIWVHLYDAHDPYDPPEPYKSRYASAPYDGEIAYVDSALGKLLGYLREHGLYPGSLIAVMADHGEALGDHGESTHGIFLYDETIRVPLLIKLPGERAAGKHIESRVGLVDVLPTLLQAAGFTVPREIQGQSLLTLLKPASAGNAATTKDSALSLERTAYAETDYPHRSFGWSSLRALRSGKISLRRGSAQRTLRPVSGSKGGAQPLGEILRCR